MPVRCLLSIFCVVTILVSVARADAPSTTAVMEQADAAYAKKDFDTAIAKFEEAIRLDSRLVRAHYGLGSALCQKGELKKAIAVLSNGIKLDPKDDQLYFCRGYVLWQSGEAEQAVEDFSMAVQLNPANDLAHNGLAWALATAPQDQLRDGKRAVKLARRACELTRYKNGFHLSTLAVAYAEIGNFDEAIRWHKQAVSLPDFPKDKLERANQRLKLYEQKKPYREIIEKKR